jgi:hypothetical protein
MVIERGAHDLQFRVLIMHRSLYVAMPHRSHDGSKISSSHQDSRTVIVPCAVENEFFRKAASLRACRKRLQIDLKCPDAERFDGNIQPSRLADFRSDPRFQDLMRRMNFPE